MAHDDLQVREFQRDSIDVRDRTPDFIWTSRCGVAEFGQKRNAKLDALDEKRRIVRVSWE
ncbi:hypothetical protein N7527_002226 [Penicillium freii]|nr:hypothetical protein N7527_002226 [Penicillium freii]